jgi:hypothetical protein
MLIGNFSVLQKTPGRFLTGSSASVEAFVRSNWSKPGANRNIQFRDQDTTARSGLSIPDGNFPQVAWMMPTKRTFISSRNENPSVATAAGALAGGKAVAGTAASVSTCSGSGQLISSAAGTAASTSTATINVYATKALGGTAASTSTASLTKKALAWVAGTAASSSSASMTPRAKGAIAGESTTATVLSPQGLADAVWSQAIEAGLTAEEIIRLLAAHAAGNATGLDANPAFKSLDGSKTRIAGTLAAGSRTITTRDGA